MTEMDAAREAYKQHGRACPQCRVAQAACNLFGSYELCPTGATLLNRVMELALRERRVNADR